MINHIRQSKNGYLQGLIFMANLCLKECRYRGAQKLASQSLNFNKIHHLKKHKSSDTLFILGSGGSITTYTSSQFDQIGIHDSIGFNFWILHRFVPTFFTAEFKPKSSRSEALWENLDLRSNDYKKTHIIFKYSNAFIEQISSMPQTIELKYLTSQLSMPGMSSPALRRWFTVLDSLGYFSQNNKSQCMLYRQASLSWLLTFAIRLGYRNIVLCGVDLNNTDYFYDIDNSYAKNNNLVIPDAGFHEDVHPTENPDKCHANTPISEVINIMQETLLEKRNINLYVGAKSSALYPAIPAYKWQESS